MQVWNLLHAVRWKHRTQKGRQKSPSGHHRTTLAGYIFATKAHIDNRKKIIKQQYILHMSPQYGELRPTNGWDRFTSLGDCHMCLSYFTASRPCYLQCWFWTCLNCLLAIFMVAVIGQTIIFSFCGFFYLLLSSSSFFLALSQRSERDRQKRRPHRRMKSCELSNGENRIAYLWTNLRYIPRYCYVYSLKVTPFLFDRRIFQVVCIISDIAVFVLKRDVKLQPTNQPRCLCMLC